MSLSDKPGLPASEMVEAMLAGRMKGMYIFGENTAVSDPNTNHAIKGFQSLEFLVVQDIFMTETAELADVVLPSASFAEKSGTFTCSERRVQWPCPTKDHPGTPYLFEKAFPRNETGKALFTKLPYVVSHELSFRMNCRMRNIPLS